MLPLILTFEKLPANPPPDIALSVPRGPVVDSVGFNPMVPLITGGAVVTETGTVFGATVGGAGSVVEGGTTVVEGAAVVGVTVEGVTVEEVTVEEVTVEGVGAGVGRVDDVATVGGGLVATVVGAATVVVGFGMVDVASVMFGMVGMVGVIELVGLVWVVGVVVAEGLASSDRISSEMSVDALA